MTDFTRLNFFEVARRFLLVLEIVRGTKYEVARRTCPLTLVKMILSIFDFFLLYIFLDL